MIQSFVALDLETTGMNPSSDRIIEIGMVRVEEGSVTGEYSHLIFPGMRISERITNITGITNEMVDGQPMIGELLPEILAFMGNLPLLGHNIIFDFSFLKKAVVNGGGTFEKEAVDTLKIARRILPQVEKKNLDRLCDYFQIPPGNSHRALDDARSAMALYYRLAQVQPEDEGFSKARPLNFSVKKEAPATPAQIRYLAALADYHHIALHFTIEALSKSQASRMIDEIISNHGKIL